MHHCFGICRIIGCTFRLSVQNEETLPSLTFAGCEYSITCWATAKPFILEPASPTFPSATAANEAKSVIETCIVQKKHGFTVVDKCASKIRPISILNSNAGGQLFAHNHDRNHRNSPGLKTGKFQFIALPWLPWPESTLESQSFCNRPRWPSSLFHAWLWLLQPTRCTSDAPTTGPWLQWLCLQKGTQKSHGLSSSSHNIPIFYSLSLSPSSLPKEFWSLRGSGECWHLPDDLLALAKWWENLLENGQVYKGFRWIYDQRTHK